MKIAKVANLLHTSVIMTNSTIVAKIYLTLIYVAIRRNESTHHL